MYHELYDEPAKLESVMFLISTGPVLSLKAVPSSGTYKGCDEMLMYIIDIIF